MAEFDEKLNQILSNPEAMAQIAKLAQSLNAPSDTVTRAAPSDSVKNAASSDDVSDPDPSENGETSVPSAGTDGGTVAQFLPLLQELGGDSNARRLLYALRPYLRPQKQEKVERALHFARLFRVGKRFLSQWEG